MLAFYSFFQILTRYIDNNLQPHYEIQVVWSYVSKRVYIQI